MATRKQRKSSKPGAAGRPTSAAARPVIEGESQEVQAVDQESDVTTATEDPQTETATEVEEPDQQEPGDGGGEQAPSEDPGAATEGEAQASSPFPDVTLANGSVITGDTVMQCASCGGRFYAKDAPDGSCPAVGFVDGKDVVCGGMLGPVEV